VTKGFEFEGAILLTEGGGRGYGPRDLFSCPLAAGKGKGTDSPLKFPEGTQPYHTLTLGFLTSRIVG
jgi:hypothetical protein